MRELRMTEVSYAAQAYKARKWHKVQCEPRKLGSQVHMLDYILLLSP